MIVILFLISFLTRLVFLYFGYPSITNDEADYFMNSYLLAKTGTDIFSEKFFLTSGILNATSSVPVYLGSLLFLFLEKSVISGRLTYAILNSLTPLFFYLILFKLTKNKAFSLIGFTVFNFSPWFSYLSSLSAIDSPTAMLFYLVAFYILLTNIKPVYKYLLFLVFNFLSFNSYMGIKTIFFFLLMIALITEKIYKKEKYNIKMLSKDVFISLIIFIVFFLISWSTPSSVYFQNRLKEKILPFNMSLIAKKVDSLREISRGPYFIRNLIHNKLTVAFSLFIEKYIQAFNPYLLFIKGDTHPIYGTNYFGLFYFFDMVFIFLGLLFFSKIFERNPFISLPFILILIVAPLAVGIMIDPPSISLRSYLSIIGYVFFITSGIYFIFNYFLKNKKLTIGITVVIYLMSFIYFFSLYQVTIKSSSGDQWHLNEKVLTDKIAAIRKKSENQNIIVYVNEPQPTLLLYLFYQEKNPVLIKKLLTQKNYSIGNIRFSSDCPQEKITGIIQIMHSGRCPVNEKVFSFKDFIPPEAVNGSRYYLLE